jgi:hypothetical protein
MLTVHGFVESIIEVDERASGHYCSMRHTFGGARLLVNSLRLGKAVISL